MGQGIAGRILTGGHDLVVYNRTPGRVDELKQAGARVATSVAEACREREVVVTTVADDAALEEVSLGSAGIRDSLPEGAIHMTMGTHGVATVQALTAAHSAAGQVMVAAHAVGRPTSPRPGRLESSSAGRRTRSAASRRSSRSSAGARSTRAPTRRRRPRSAANNFVLGCAIEVMGEAFSRASTTSSRRCSTS